MKSFHEYIQQREIFVPEQESPSQQIPKDVRKPSLRPPSMIPQQRVPPGTKSFTARPWLQQAPKASKREVFDPEHDDPADRHIDATGHAPYGRYQAKNIVRKSSFRPEYLDRHKKPHEMKFKGQVRKTA